MYMKQIYWTNLYVYTTGTHWPHWISYIHTIAAPPRLLIQPSLHSSFWPKDDQCPGHFYQLVLQTSLAEPSSSNMEYTIVKQATMHAPPWHKKHFVSKEQWQHIVYEAKWTDRVMSIFKSSETCVEDILAFYLLVRINMF